MEKNGKVPYIPSQVGIVYVWGKGLDGQLGLGSKMVDEPFPQEVTTLSNSKIRLVACGGSFTVAISENGDCYTWGSSQAGQLGHNSSAPEPLPKIAREIHGLNIRDIQCGTSHTILLNDAQKVYSLGNNSSGQCGVVSVSNIFSPRVMQTLYRIDIIKLACGAGHTLLLTAKGNVWSCGNNEYGQLGTGDCKEVTVPKQIKELKNISEIAAGSNHSGAVDFYGNMYSFGKGKNGQLGLGVSTTKNTRLVTPTKIEFFVDRKVKVVSMAMGDDHSLALDSKNQLWSWGSSKDGQCGHGNRDEYPTPAMVALDKQFVKIASGPKHCAALTENGQLYTWGSGYQYKLGHGTVGDELIPRLVSRLTELCVKSVSCGLHHTVALVNKLPSLSNDLRNLLNCPSFSDIVIVVGGNREGFLGC